MRYKVYSILVIVAFCIINFVSCRKVEEEVNPFQAEWDECVQYLKSKDELNNIGFNRGYGGHNSLSFNFSVRVQQDLDSCIEEAMRIMANEDAILSYVIYGGDTKGVEVGLICLYINLIDENGELIDSTYLYGDWKYGFQAWSEPGMQIGTWDVGDEGIYDLKDYRTVTQVDSDGDRLSDKYEIAFGYDPNNPETEPGLDDAHMAGPSYWRI